MQAAETAVSPDAFRRAMRSFSAGVTVITSRHHGHDHGMTATAFASLTADPPSVMIAVNRAARSHPLLAGSGAFGVNILSERQRAVSERFAAAGEDQFAGLTYRHGPMGVPVLDGCVAHAVCRVAERHDFGSHSVFFGQVVECAATPRRPLLYHDGAYGSVVGRTSDLEIAPVFTDRWSPRAFAVGTIDEATLMSCFEAARWAPSVSNDQPWRFAYVLPGQQNWERCMAALAPEDQSWAYRGAAFVAFASRAEGEALASFDTGAAWMSFALQAALKGWHSRALAAVDHGALAGILRLPGGWRIEAVAVLGRIGDAAGLPPGMQADERPSARRSLADLVSAGGFGV